MTRVITCLFLCTTLFVSPGCEEETGLSPEGGGTSRAFMYPHGVGSQWVYDYTYWENYPKIAGTYTWEVTSANPSSVTFLVIRQEDVQNNPYLPPVHVESTTSISLDLNSSTMTLPITEEGLPSTHDVPRTTAATSDTALVNWTSPGPSYESAAYVSGVGLIRYYGRGGTGNNPKVHALTLVRYELK